MEADNELQAELWIADAVNHMCLAAHALGQAASFNDSHATEDNLMLMKFLRAEAEQRRAPAETYEDNVILFPLGR